MKLINNTNNRLIDDLKTTIKKESKLSIAASSFSIPKELNNLQLIAAIDGSDEKK